MIMENELRTIFEITFNADLRKCILSAPRRKSQEVKKTVIRPVLLRGELMMQFEYHFEKKVTHENVSIKQAGEQAAKLTSDAFKQINIFTTTEEINILASKPDKARIRRKKIANTTATNKTEIDRTAVHRTETDRTETDRIETDRTAADRTAANTTAANKTETESGRIGAGKTEADRNSVINSRKGLLDASYTNLLDHDRKKNYIIKEGEPCDFLIRLGVMDESGRVFKKHYSKFRQINRFLEIVRDAYTDFSGKRKNSFDIIKIIDFGCGKAYLTFALYYYFTELEHIPAEITGLDLKEDVIEFCNNVAISLGYDGLTFKHGDIADYTDDGCDMVVTLHACDTATDYALINAVKWNAPLILSVPCCQHELFKQIRNEQLRPMLRYGIIKDKFTELLTDSLRALALEARGYDVAMVEFTTLEHTQKNIMIRAVKKRSENDPKSKRALKEFSALEKQFGVSSTAGQILASLVATGQSPCDI